jgi:hypothetical protein
MKFIFSPSVLFGKIAIYKAKKTANYIAERDIWFRGDDNFIP